MNKFVEVITGAGSYRMLNPAATKPENYFRNYPPLFHNTDENGARGIITSGSLWARPISNFGDEDVEEYRHGLVILRDNLYPRLMDFLSRQPSAPNVEALAKFGIDLSALTGRIVDYIAAELKEFDNGTPYLTIYVACFSTGQAGGKFGRVQLSMNPLLPVLAYAHPAGAFGSGISFVSYSAERLILHTLELMLTGPQVRSYCIQSMKWNSASRLDKIAARLATDMMVLAPNLKREKYAAENEWRFKVFFQNLPEVRAANEPHVNRAKLGLPVHAAYSSHEPKRLVAPISIDGKAIINEVRIVDGNGNLTPALELEELRQANCMPLTSEEDAKKFIDDRGLLTGKATLADLASAVAQRQSSSPA